MLDGLTHSIQSQIEGLTMLNTRECTTEKQGSFVLESLHKRFKDVVTEADYRKLSPEEFGQLEAYQQAKASYRIGTVQRAKEVIERDRSKKLAKGVHYQVEAYASMLRVKQVAAFQQEQKGGGGRGACSGFSDASRRRLIRLTSMWNFEGQYMHFVTLTYPGVWAADWRVWKNDLRVFKQWLTRSLPSLVGGVWRVEFQKRGAPHFHLLVATDARICSCKPEKRMMPNGKGKKVERQVHGASCRLHLFRSRIAAKWAETVKRGYVNDGGDSVAYEEHYQNNIKAGTQVEAVDSRRQLMAYVSKYIAKSDQQEADRQRRELEAAGESVPWGEETLAFQWGRNWGKFGSLDTAPVQVEEFTSEQAARLKRVVVKWMQAGGQEKYAERVKKMRGFCVLGLGVKVGEQTVLARMLRLVSAGFINGTYCHRDRGARVLSFYERACLGAYGDHFRVKVGSLVDTAYGRAVVQQVTVAASGNWVMVKMAKSDSSRALALSQVSLACYRGGWLRPRPVIRRAQNGLK